MDSRELARAMVGATPSASLASIDERLRRNQTAQTNLSRMRRVMAAVGATDAMHVYQKSEGGAYAPAAWIDEGLLPCSERDLRCGVWNMYSTLLLIARLPAMARSVPAEALDFYREACGSPEGWNGDVFTRVVRDVGRSRGGRAHRFRGSRLRSDGS